MWQYNHTDELYHHGVKGMRWGVRRFQKKDGSLTPAGKKRYENKDESPATYKTKDKIDASLNGNSRIWAYNQLNKKNANRVVVDGQQAAYTLKDGKLAQIDESNMRSVSNDARKEFMNLVEKASLSSYRGQSKQAEHYVKKAQEIIDKHSDAKLTDLNSLRSYGEYRMRYNKDNLSFDFSEFENRLK